MSLNELNQTSNECKANLWTSGILVKLKELPVIVIVC